MYHSYAKAVSNISPGMSPNKITSASIPPSKSETVFKCVPDISPIIKISVPDITRTGDIGIFVIFLSS